MPKDKLFQQLSNLEVLILSSCELTAIGSQAFHSLEKLWHVDLSHNKLIVFSTDAFSNLKSIYLNFAHNGICVLPRDKLASLSGHCIINLSYNPLDRTCSNIGLVTWYKYNLDKIEDPEGTRPWTKVASWGSAGHHLALLWDSRSHCGCPGHFILWCHIHLGCSLFQAKLPANISLWWRYRKNVQQLY